MASCPPGSGDSAYRQTGLPVHAAEKGELGPTVPRLLRPGDLCPRCGEEVLDYDSTLNLACPRCGLIQAGSFS